MTDTTDTPEPARPTPRELFTAAAEHARTNGNDPYALAFEHLAGQEPESTQSEAPAEQQQDPHRF